MLMDDVHELTVISLYSNMEYYLTDRFMHYHTYMTSTAPDKIYDADIS